MTHLRLHPKHTIFKLRLYLFFLIFIVYLTCANGFPWVEANSQLQKAKRILYDFSLSTPQRTWDGEIQGGNGRYYDPHGLMNIIFMFPIASLEPIVTQFIHKDTDKLISFLAALTGTIMNALICVIFFSILILFRRPLRICFYSAICVAFLTIIFPYATKNYEGNLNMLFIISALYFVFKFLEKQNILYLALCGINTGLAINTREFSFLFLICLTIFILWLSVQQRNTRLIIVFLASVLPFLVLWAYYNWLRTGFFYLTPIASYVVSGIEERPNFMKGNLIIGLKGLLLSQGGEYIYLFSHITIILFWMERFFTSSEKR